MQGCSLALFLRRRMIYSVNISRFPSGLSFLFPSFSFLERRITTMRGQHPFLLLLLFFSFFFLCRSVTIPKNRDFDAFITLARFLLLSSFWVSSPLTGEQESADTHVNANV